MSSCSRSDRVLAYMLGDMDEQETAQFAEHLEQCSRCRFEIQLEKALQKGLEECTHPDAVPAGLRISVMRRLLTVSRPGFPFRQIAATVVIGIAAAAAVFHVLSGIQLPDVGLGFISRVASGLMNALEQAESLPLMLGIGLVMVVGASIVAAAVPEE